MSWDTDPSDLSFLEPEEYLEVPVSIRKIKTEAKWTRSEKFRQQCRDLNPVRLTDQGRQRLAEAARQIHLGRKRSDETRNKLSAANKGKTGFGNSKKIQTPDGVFQSKTAAAHHYGVDPTTLLYWMRVSKSTEFYYIKETP
jgi:hypothetical protein